jgi:hypothetical protein
LQDGHAGSAARLLAEAEGLWRGTALADLTSVVGETESAALEEERLAAQEDRIDADLRTGRAAEVIVELEKLVAAQPVRERPVALLIDALEADARTPDALRVYARLRRTLAEELGADPSPALQQRHAELLGARTTSTRTRTNLRAQLTSFLGRDAELAQLSELIGQSRLVTLIGRAVRERPGSHVRLAPRWCPIRQTGSGWSSWPQSPTRSIWRKRSSARSVCATP